MRTPIGQNVPAKRRRCLICTLPGPHGSESPQNGYNAHDYDSGALIGFPPRAYDQVDRVIQTEPMTAGGTPQ